jgi:hypothetical protein
LVPTRLPGTVLPDEPIEIPAFEEAPVLVPESRLRAAGVTPPIVLFGDVVLTKISIRADAPCGPAALPVASVPMKLPATVLPPRAVRTTAPVTPLMTRPCTVLFPPAMFKFPELYRSATRSTAFVP